MGTCEVYLVTPKEYKQCRMMSHEILWNRRGGVPYRKWSSSGAFDRLCLATIFEKADSLQRGTQQGTEFVRGGRRWLGRPYRCLGVSGVAAGAGGVWLVWGIVQGGGA